MQASFTQHEIGQSGLELKDIEEIVLWDPTNWVNPTIRTSEDPGLRISGNEAMVQRYKCSRRGNTLYLKLGGGLFERIADALTTSLTRKRIHIDLRVDSLDRVRATGMVEIDTAGWKEGELEVRLFGPTALWGGRFRMMRP